MDVEGHSFESVHGGNWIWMDSGRVMEMDREVENEAPPSENERR